ncbi:MAG: hypothetical protein COS99_07940 [Candidatus Omnitrophica bacterium CG07_land_8_20_14_0_80_42_15]|uniref:VTT domain-containing protein n=1 Tax=Candidatus Aquitaenariimonas noxiae TaxID=1974741 RepID=A0A2J0L398_9BACT|nr:MAG: hypothetical protein COS99_07940 [Candidatus Omnitrophica bacterium CG07_land_8_20_14_0_80_42_15]
MIEQILQSDLIELIKRFGNLGVFIAMFLESSVVPIPSEAIVIGAGAIGISIYSIVIFGSLGSTLGAMVGYSLGRYLATPVILRFGKYVFIKPHHIYKAEAFAKKYGVPGVIIGRVLPIIPFKVFSIASGITKIPFIPFVLCTLVGVIPRMYVLALFGSAVLKFQKPVVIVVGVAILIFAAFKLTKKMYNGRNGGKNV